MNDDVSSYAKKCSIENKDAPIRVNNNKLLQSILSLIINRSKHHVRVFAWFDDNESKPFEIFSPPILLENIQDFLLLPSSKLTILTNRQKTVRASDFYKNISSKDFLVKAIS